MSRYLLFAGDYGLRRGGMWQFKGVFNDARAAEEIGRTSEWYEVVDLENGATVYWGRDSGYEVVNATLEVRW